MLQPFQLEDVSARYAGEIAELHTFLERSGVSVNTPQTLDLLLRRVHDDRGFHRDLTSYLWVAIDRAGRQMSTADLLGVVAIAAAGPVHAAAAEEAIAHDLLRLVMETRRSIDAAPHAVEASSPAPPIAVPASFAAEAVRPSAEARLPREGATVWTRPDDTGIHGGSAPFVEEDEEQAGTARRIVWLAVAACVLALLGTVAWMLLSPAAVAPVGQTATVVVRPLPTAQPAPQVAAPAAPAPIVSRQESVRTTSAAPRRADRAARPEATPREPQVASAAPVERMPSRSANVPVAQPSAPIATRPAPAVVLPPASTATVRGAVPAATLSQRLGSRSVPVYASSPEADSSATTGHVPRLLRRQPASAAPPLQDEVAEVRPTDAPSIHPQSATPAAGTVRPGALGIMAGNLLYSPAPVYPVAASAARVQGEVKVQAEVDRDGNVSYARVVSGPPLLRDAAVAAVQHWRYKPYLAHGKPVPMTAMAVVEFELD